MAVTNAQIRDLLNRPRGLNEGTITEYVTVRTNEVNKRARGTQYLATDSPDKVSDALKDDAVKMLVCADCLSVLIDTYVSTVPENDRGEQDRRFKEQMKVFQERGAIALKLIAEAAGSAYSEYQTSTQLT
jgi:hypothetical protein|tara:strand:- start:1223 stop:1612 length:390 start_codon:yes stop_codon:yes gene_type:complete